MSNSIDSMFSCANGISKGSLGTDICFCLEESKFYIYDKRYWKQIDDLELTSMILDKYSGQNNLIDIRFYTSTRRKQILDNLKPLVFKRLEIFNKTGFLNFDLGEFDPMTGYMYDHQKDNYSTFTMSYPYHHSAKCDLWIKTLNEIFENDKEKIDILQEFFGYCLTRDTRKEKALLLLGESRTGKSTILETMQEVIGKENCAFVPLDYIKDQQYSPMLMNKLINFDTDASSKALNYEREFRIITSGEHLTCNQKFIKTFDFKPYCKLVMAANEFPRITDHSSAFYNRLILLPCDRVFTPAEQNIALKDSLKLELSGIFNWAVEGLQRLNARGKFEDKQFMRDAIEELRDDSNPIEVFFRDTIEVDINGKEQIEKGELYNKYCEWCRSNGNAPMSTIKLSRSILRKYARVTEKNSQSGITGNKIWKNLKYRDKKINNQQNEKIMWDGE